MLSSTPVGASLAGDCWRYHVLRRYCWSLALCSSGGSGTDAYFQRSGIVRYYHADFIAVICFGTGYVCIQVEVTIGESAFLLKY